MATNANLKEITQLLDSKDFKRRFVGEYMLVKTKACALDDMIDHYYDGNLGFTPTCPITVLEAQSNAMWTYIKILEYRADLELIELPRG